MTSVTRVYGPWWECENLEVKVSGNHRKIRYCLIGGNSCDNCPVRRERDSVPIEPAIIEGPVTFECRYLAQGYKRIKAFKHKIIIPLCRIGNNSCIDCKHMVEPDTIYAVEPKEDEKT